MRASHGDKLLRSIEPHGFVPQGSKVTEIAAGSTTQIKNRIRRVALYRIEECRIILADIVVSRTVPESPGEPIVIRDRRVGEAPDLFRIIPSWGAAHHIIDPAGYPDPGSSLQYSGLLGQLFRQAYARAREQAHRILGPNRACSSKGSARPARPAARFRAAPSGVEHSIVPNLDGPFIGLNQRRCANGMLRFRAESSEEGQGPTSGACEPALMDQRPGCSPCASPMTPLPARAVLRPPCVGRLKLPLSGRLRTAEIDRHNVMPRLSGVLDFAYEGQRTARRRANGCEKSTPRQCAANHRRA